MMRRSQSNLTNSAQEHSMNTVQKILVQTSFEKVAPLADTAAAMFYQRLFALDPGLRHLFRGDIHDQGRKLMHMLGAAVAGLDDPEALVPQVQALGKRHRGYGVSDAQYATVASALLWTLEQALGPDFTPQVRDAWAAVYTVLAGLMQQAGPNQEDLAAAGRRRSRIALR
jgi:hemoglobin-like flavoprotein